MFLSDRDQRKADSFYINTSKKRILKRCFQNAGKAEFTY